MKKWIQIFRKFRINRFKPEIAQKRWNYFLKVRNLPKLCIFSWIPICTLYRRRHPNAYYLCIEIVRIRLPTSVGFWKLNFQFWKGYCRFCVSVTKLKFDLNHYFHVKKFAEIWIVIYANWNGISFGDILDILCHLKDHKVRWHGNFTKGLLATKCYSLSIKMLKKPTVKTNIFLYLHKKWA